MMRSVVVMMMMMIAATAGLVLIQFVNSFPLKEKGEKKAPALHGSGRVREPEAVRMLPLLFLLLFDEKNYPHSF